MPRCYLPSLPILSHRIRFTPDGGPGGAHHGWVLLGPLALGEPSETFVLFCFSFVFFIRRFFPPTRRARQGLQYQPLAPADTGSGEWEVRRVSLRVLLRKGKPSRIHVICNFDFVSLVPTRISGERKKIKFKKNGNICYNEYVKKVMIHGNKKLNWKNQSRR